ncbi:NADPH2:quinone reductase [Kwoniella heveanensis BCC8398]|uniref:NADPH2:quinone reductase n=1 Tax=Kwoniella heveanensis BCC8398 TaxID=1296120 RepID=A0A1B9GWB2_9TREE|nr:NADPH2:quinone reductase [Kwoniella heveanensis BCC8398]
MSSQVQIPKTMKAIQADKTGGPEVNVLREIPVPQPKDNEVLIKVQWTGVNYIDIYFRTGLYPKPSYPYTIGQDAVGTIVSLPPASSSSSNPSLKIGQKVYTTAGNAFAEYLVAPVDRVAVLPDDLKPEDAKDGVSMATQGLTALYLVKESYAIRKGDWVLVRAAAGGVGLILTQVTFGSSFNNASLHQDRFGLRLAKHLGANVIGTVSSSQKAEIVTQNGVDHVLLTTAPSEENVKKVLELTGGQGVHAVYDSVGKDTWDEDFEVVRRKGTVVSYGNASGAVPAFTLAKLTPKAVKITRPTLFAIVNTQQEWTEYTDELTDLTRNGVTKYAVHKVYDFTEEGVRQAQVDIEGRGTSGKLLIHVSD